MNSIRMALMAVTLALAGTVQAADLQPAPATPVSAWSWSGFHVGGNVGYGWSDGGGTYHPLAGAPSMFDIHLWGHGQGYFGGLQAGYDFQINPWVLGAETDFQFSNGEGTINNDANPLAGFGPGKSRSDWFGTIRGRIGYDIHHWLFYATGGVAYAQNTVTGTLPVIGIGVGAPQNVQAKDSALGWSWTVGGGVEVPFLAQWSLKAEYLYFGPPSDVPIIKLSPTSTVTGNAKSQLVRVGVNYHF